MGIHTHAGAVSQFPLRVLFRAAIFLSAIIGSNHPCPAATPQLWVYCPTNLLVDANLDKLDVLWKRAHAAGYTHVLLEDSKLSRLDMLGSNAQHYNSNVARARQMAAADQLALVPAVFSIGYSNDLLGHDPNLAEGLPVVDTPFTVHGDLATVDVDDSLVLGKMSFKDDTVQVDGNSATVPPCKGNARFVFHLKLAKFHCYHVSVMVKTEHFSGDVRINPLAGDQSLNFANLGQKPTQDWTQLDAVFDTLENSDVNLYFGIWGGSKGTLQWRDWKIHEAGLVNVLRRPGTPCVVKAGDRTLVEGTDYDRILDPLMGCKPWAGEYTAWHSPPVIHTHHLADGTHLKISWFYPPIAGDGQVNICVSEPATAKLLQDQSKLVKEAFQSPGYMMSFDEIRCMNQDDACRDRKMDAGPMLAKTLHDCTQLLEPATVYTWSDMFDPFHNAHDNYYLVRGNLTGSWNGLQKDVVVMNWNFGNRDKSLKFFADRGNRQIIAGYYDSDLKDMSQWLESAGKVTGVIGMMYTTWSQNYSQLEKFAEMCKGD
jgi:hypothetical protein